MAGSTTIIRGISVTITPTAIDQYDATEELNTLVRKIPGRRNPDISSRPADPRTGTLSMLFASTMASSELIIVGDIIVHADSDATDGEADSKYAADKHTEGGTFLLTNGVLDTIDMYYVPVGQVRRTLEDAKLGSWRVEVGFQELIP